MNKTNLKCWKDHPDCFANEQGLCCVITPIFKDGKKQKHIPQATKFRKECPFYKTVKEAGGTYTELCERFEVLDDRGRRIRT